MTTSEHHIKAVPDIPAAGAVGPDADRDAEAGIIEAGDDCEYRPAAAHPTLITAPRLGRGLVWSDIVADIERDNALRNEAKEAA